MVASTEILGTVRFWESFLKRDENAMIHAELNWKGDSFQTVLQ